MRQIVAAHPDALKRAVESIRIQLSCELAGQWGIGPMLCIDLDRCDIILSEYEERAGITLVSERRLMADIRSGRQCGE